MPNLPCSAPPRAASTVAQEIQATDWAYGAGFVDGEGCIAVARSFVKGRGKFSYGVVGVVSNRDRQVLEWFRDMWSGNVVRARSGGGGQGTFAREAWNWRSPTGQSARFFMQGIRPFLRIKTKQCDNALAMIELLRRSRRTLGPYAMPTEWLEQQERLYLDPARTEPPRHRCLRQAANALTAPHHRERAIASSSGV